MMRAVINSQCLSLTNFIIAQFKQINRIVNCVHVKRSYCGINGKPLVDQFNRQHNYLRISITERCNLRCKYCMPEDGVLLSTNTDLLTTDEILRLAHLFVVKLGVNKIKLTGGEPLVRKDCLHLIAGLSRLKRFGLDNLGITTNGLLLHNRINDLVSAGLQSLNISLDTLRGAKFELITRRKGFQRIWKGINEAIYSKAFQTLKLNVVVMRGFNEDELIDFVELTKDHLIDVRFIEYMPFDGNKWCKENMFTFQQMMEILKANYLSDLLPLNRVNSSDTSLPYKINNYLGKFGFISSMTKNFCGSCNRLRITANGNLKVCLFDKNEISLRDCLRSNASDDEICQVIANKLKEKKRGHPGATNIAKNVNRPMILIARRNYCTSREDNQPNYLQLSHVDEETGNVKMIDVSGKPAIKRVAVAEGEIYVGNKVIEAINKNLMEKGPVLTTAHIAAVMAAKSTSNLIPLCHPIAISNVQVVISLSEDSVKIVSSVTSISATGVEMEALTSISIGLLTIYDMCKSMKEKMVVKSIRLVDKRKEEDEGNP